MLREPSSGIRQTATKLYSGSKNFRSACSTNIRPVRLQLVESKESSLVEEEEIKNKMNDDVDTSLASEEIDQMC